MRLLFSTSGICFFNCMNSSSSHRSNNSSNVFNSIFLSLYIKTFWNTYFIFLIRISPNYSCKEILSHHLHRFRPAYVGHVPGEIGGAALSEQERSDEVLSLSLRSGYRP